MTHRQDANENDSGTKNDLHKERMDYEGGNHGIEKPSQKDFYVINQEIQKAAIIKLKLDGDMPEIINDDQQ
jgi:hypothetical protein